MSTNRPPARHRSRRLLRAGLALPLITLSPLAITNLAAAEETGTDEPTRLAPLSVSAARSPVPVETVGSAVTVITAEQIEALQIRQVDDALRLVPGLAVSRTGSVGGTSQIRIRGSEANQTLVRIDGIEVSDPSGDSDFDFGHLLAYEIERIEVLRGPQSALYGSDAVGGVIDITTKRGSGPLSGSVRTEAGSFDTREAVGTVSYGDQTFDALVSTQSFRTDGISSADERAGNLEKDGYRNRSAFAKFGWRPAEDVEFALVGRTVRYRADTDAYSTIPEDDPDDLTTGTQTFLRGEARYAMADGRWRHKIGLATTEHDRNYRDGDLITSTYLGRRVKADYQTDYGFETGAVSHDLSFGLDHERESARTWSSWAPGSVVKHDYESTGFAGEYRLGLYDQLFLSAAGRYDRNGLFDDQHSWRATAAWLIPGTDTRLRASYGTGIKNPTLFELYGYTNTYRGNPNLKPEEATGWDAGVEHSFLDGRLVVDLGWFRQDIKNLIQGNGPSSENLPGTSRINGVEASMTIRPLAWIDLRLAYTYTDGKDSHGEELVRRAPHIASADLMTRFLDDRARAGIAVIYNGEQKDWAYDASYARHPVTLDDYTLVNLTAAYDLTDTVEIFGRIDNLFDEEYQEVLGYGSRGRAGYAGLRMRF
ncbi:TonB-dependent receptor [Tistrella mobilis]|uniref:TonB-dependent receptor plug domain-containing protein n=1 Tax=Tistrella mobilis TaxID=171437 RepID=UPI0031F62D12